MEDQDLVLHNYFTILNSEPDRVQGEALVDMKDIDGSFNKLLADIEPLNAHYGEEVSLIHNTRLKDIVSKEIIPIKLVSHDTSDLTKSSDIGRMSFPNSASTSLG